MVEYKDYLSSQLLLKSGIHVSELSKSQIAVHEYVTSNAEQMIYSALAQLSAVLKVGEATIVRYCRKLGFNGYTDFKLELFRIVSQINDASNTSYIEQITDNMTKAIIETKQIIDEEKINKAAQLIDSSKRVYIVGQGLSQQTAMDVFSRFTRIGIDATIVTDSHFSYMYSALHDSDTVTLCYSFSGETFEVLKTAKIAKENNSKIISITNYETSELSELSDITLLTKGFEKTISGGSLTSKIAQYFISDVLITKCAMNNIEHTKKSIEITTKTVMNLDE